MRPTLCGVSFRWENDQIVADLPHARVVFSTARGGVSEGPFASLNLGLLTADAPENVAENRRRLGKSSVHPWPRFCYGRQVHGTSVRRATEPPSAARPLHRGGRPGDRVDRRRRDRLHRRLPAGPARPPGGVAALHCGWRPLAGGIVERGRAALREVGGDGPITAALGPAARGCCYEVGEEVHAHFAAYDARRGERNLDLADGGARAAEAARRRRCSTPGSARSATTGFFSHRRDQGITGRQSGVDMPRLITGLDAARIRANLERIRARSPTPGATPPRSRSSPRSSTSRSRRSACSREAGLDAAGREPRPGARGQGDPAPRLPLALHRPAAVAQGQAILPYVELIHSVASESALRAARDARHAGDARSCSRSTSPGRRARPGIAPGELPRYLEASPVKVVGPDDDAAVRGRSGGQPRRTSRALRELAGEHGLEQLSHGHVARTSRSLQRKVQRLCGSARRSIRRM